MMKNFKYAFIGLTFLLSCLSSAGQEFKNLDLAKICDSSKTGFCYWDLSWGQKGSVSADRTGRTTSLRMQGATENSVAFTEQSAATNFKTVSIITVSAEIKSDSVQGKGAGLNIGLYDKNNVLIANKDMGGYYSLDWIRGSADWKKYSISVIAPVETSKIKIGGILYGKGKAWFKNYKVSIASIESRKPGKLAKQFIGAACDTIRNNSLVRDSLNIAALKATALKIAGAAKTYADCYLAINYLLESLRPYGDEHSFFMTAKEVENWKSQGSQVSKIQYPSFKIIDSCGYILVPAFHGGNQDQILSFADSLQSIIQRLYNSGIKGWLIDLRENTGGNMAPMIAGLGPLFSSEKLGALIDVNGKPNSWFYKAGKYYWDNDTGWSVTRPVYLQERLPLAVLTAGRTGSSGEAVAISFIGNEKTRSFGAQTWGLTTGNGSFELTDGSQIFLASTIMADRNGKEYRGSIKPDFTVEDLSPGNVVDAAVKWIKNN
jgi:hypothetical protein